MVEEKKERRKGDEEKEKRQNDARMRALHNLTFSSSDESSRRLSPAPDPLFTLHAGECLEAAAPKPSRVCTLAI